MDKTASVELTAVHLHALMEENIAIIEAADLITRDETVPW